MGSLAAMNKALLTVTAKKMLPSSFLKGWKACALQGFRSRCGFQLCGGIRSGMGYVGAVSIEDLQKKAKFVKITNAGLREVTLTTCKSPENLPTTHWRNNVAMKREGVAVIDFGGQ